MTKPGLYLIKKTVTKTSVSRRIAISTSKLSELTLNDKTKLKSDELYLIALSFDADPCEILKKIYGQLKLAE
jgi:DNA-binding Xre family transcriptional regulator